MASQAFSSSRPTPRWLRRFVVAARRSNVFFLLEIFFAAAFLAMVASTWLTFSEAPPGGQSLPSRQVAGLLVGRWFRHWRCSSCSDAGWRSGARRAARRACMSASSSSSP